MFALILSNITLDDILDHQTFDLLKEIESDIKGLCFVLHREPDENLYFIEEKIKELEVNTSFINIKRPSKEKLIIKNGVRLLQRRRDFKFILYANTIEQIHTFNAFKHELKALSPKDDLSELQVFSNRYVHYNNIYRLEDFLLRKPA
ncbi:MAG: hypothetical protein CMB99_08000 [Flavobacteriaceae bacterium]|nr:hypothetical protein [Flavobacteriaceae bacterium]|tara:strand:- start:154462 stop:154902 length:441 start_codon:yes stop_codon:yes gene_type:complete